MRATLVAGLSAVLLLAAAAGAEDLQITGTVVDARGEPVAGVELGTYWEINPDDAFSSEGVESGADGAFVLELQRFRPPVVVLALDLQGRRAGLLQLDSEEALQEQHTVVLAPAVQVTARLSTPAMGRPPSWASVMFIRSGRARVVSSSTTTGAISVPLPPGDYKLWVYGRDVRGLTRKVTVPAGVPTFDVGTIEMEPTVIARHVGKPPPAWHVTEARGLEPEVTLADFEGKWVLLEFWGYW